ncbi:MAG: HAMP domain-containing sensor histidine kinase [Acidobacteriota bacterium]
MVWIPLALALALWRVHPPLADSFDERTDNAAERLEIIIEELDEFRGEHAEELAAEAAERARAARGGTLTEEERSDIWDRAYDQASPEEWTGRHLLWLLDEQPWLRDWLNEEEICWLLFDQVGAWLDGNLVPELFVPRQEDLVADPKVSRTMRTTVQEVDDAWFAAPLDFFVMDGVWTEGGARDVRLSSPVSSGLGEPLQCLMHQLHFADGARLRLGVHNEPQDLDASLLIAPAAALLSLLLAGAGSYRLARRTIEFVEDLRRARSHLESDALPRLRRPGDDGDFDRATREINAILERLDGALSSLGHVTDNIAHDLRTPLTRLQGQLEMLRRSDRPTDTMLTAVQDEADQLLATFNALLRIAQVESGSRRRGFRRFDMARVVADVAELYAPAFADDGTELDLSLPEGPVELDGDADLWMQALSNLLDNALKHTPSGGRVRLELHADRLQLRDSGPGIPETEHHRVFERFYRGSARGRQAPRGAGLGLSLVAAICELHGAAIELENDDGLVVRIRFA